MKKKRLDTSNPLKLAFISCQDYTTLASRRLDQDLSVRERIAYWIHHAACMVCRRFNRQISLIDRAAGQLGRAEDADLLPDKTAIRPEFIKGLEKAVEREAGRR